MNEKLENSKPDIACKPGYTTTAKAVLSELHENLLTTLEDKLKDNEANNLLVIGPGIDILPYANNPDKLRRIVSGGNLILSEYNPEICKELHQRLKDAGINDYSLEEMKDFDKDKKNKLYVQEADVRFGIDVPENSIDAIDMTVSVHHATPYMENLDFIFDTAYKALKPRGILVIGEGNVDMKYSERKINNIRSDYKEIFGEDAAFADYRLGDKSNPLKLEQGSASDENAGLIEVLSDGLVSIKSNNNDELLEKFMNKNYFDKIDIDLFKTVKQNDDSVVFPLVHDFSGDAMNLKELDSRRRDYEGLIVPVDNYYGAIESILKKQLREEDFVQLIKPLHDERANARRGLVEFYTPPIDVAKSMELSGFEIDTFKYTKKGPFVTIVGTKPY